MRERTNPFQVIVEDRVDAGDQRTIDEDREYIVRFISGRARQVPDPLYRFFYYTLGKDAGMYVITNVTWEELAGDVDLIRAHGRLIREELVVAGTIPDTSVVRLVSTSNVMPETGFAVPKVEAYDPATLGLPPQ